ncbi:MAG: hypothetical protein JNM00_08825 [Flavobacteriales bacterium]|nr:hypothetical protein [Flavobacteriales bacterium]
MTEKQRQSEQLKRDLMSDDLATVVSALKKCRESGDVSAVPVLIGLYATTQVPMIRKETGEMLGSLKVTGSEQAFMAALKMPGYANIRQDLVSFMWNSGVQPNGYLSELVELALHGSFGEALECLTLIEGMDGPFAEEQVLESLTAVKKYLGTAVSDEKSALFRDLLVMLEAAAAE